MEKHIKKEDMKDFCIYYCEARNFNFGIWHNDRMFGIRHKFGDEFIDEEFHYDDGAPYGTCKPLIQLTSSNEDRIHESFFDRSNWRGQCVIHDILSPFERLEVAILKVLNNELVAKGE